MLNDNTISGERSDQRRSSADEKVACEGCDMGRNAEGEGSQTRCGHIRRLPSSPIRCDGIPDAGDDGNEVIMSDKKIASDCDWQGCRINEDPKDPSTLLSSPKVKPLQEDGRRVERVSAGSGFTAVRSHFRATLVS